MCDGTNDDLLGLDVVGGVSARVRPAAQEPHADPVAAAAADDRHLHGPPVLADARARRVDHWKPTCEERMWQWEGVVGHSQPSMTGQT